jgi:hypothetical protein
MRIKSATVFTIISLFIVSSFNVFPKGTIANSAADCNKVNSSTNLIKNPSFETSTGAADLSNWTATNGTIYSNTTYKACGSRGIYLNSNGGLATVLQRLNISSALPVGANFTFSAYAGTHNPTCKIKLVVKFYKADNTEILPSLSVNVTKNVDVAPLNEIDLYSITGTVPSGASYINVGGSIECDYIKLDAVSLVVNCVPVFAVADKAITIYDCNLAQINLNDILTNETAGGVWSLNGAVVSNIVTPKVGASTAVYTYTVKGATTACATDQSIVTVNTLEGPKVNAGADISTCAENEIILAPTLGGSAKTATWSDGGAGGIFTPNAQTLNAKYKMPAVTNTVTLTLTVNDPTSGFCNTSTSDNLVLKAVPCNVTGPLPVKLEKFTGKVSQNGVELMWNTSQEKEFSHYEVQASSNGTEFGFMAQVNGANTKTYSYLDFSPKAGTNYYRLKMVDTDGSFTYSNMIAIKYELGQGFVNVQNPITGNEILVTTNMSKPNFVIFGMAGNQLNINVKQIGDNTFAIKLNNAQPGIYFLNIAADKKITTKKLMLL